MAGVEITRSGRTKLLKAGVVLSEHTDPDEAIEHAINAGPGEYEVHVAPKKIKVPKPGKPEPTPGPIPVPPEPLPEPTPPIPPVPTPIPPAGTQRALLGGWRLAQEFARGAIAIDFSTMRCWMAGHAQQHTVCEFQLPPMGIGPDMAAWPIVTPTNIRPPWWDDFGAYPNGLAFFRGKVWVATRVFYAQNEAVTPDLRLYADDGEIITLPLPRQRFGGFVKRGPGLDPYIGCGGYESGQGTQSGPSLATLDGQVLIQYGWPDNPGPTLEHWNERAPRDPNYSVSVDNWMGWAPRTVNGELQGRWASDRINGGGLVLPDGITYWPWMATGGPLDYALQTYTFVPDVDNRTYAYRYDPSAFTFLDYTLQPDFGSSAVKGQELGPDGKVYLALENQWQSAQYVADVAIKVYG